MLRHVAWFNETTIKPDAKGYLASPDKAVRQRCLMPARLLEELGVPCSVFGNLHDAEPQHVAQHLQKLHTDIVVITNIQNEAMFNLARMAKHLGCYVIADFADARANPGCLTRFAGIADLIITAAANLADPYIQQGHSVVVIPDAEDGTAHQTAAESVAKLWFETFQHLKTKPPICANSNSPQAADA